MPCPRITSIKLIQPGFFDDQLHRKSYATGPVPCSPGRSRPRSRDFSRQACGLKTEDGHRRVVRHGHLPDAR